MGKKKGTQEESMDFESEVVTGEGTVETKKKKLGKTFEGTIVTLTEGQTGTSISFDFTDLPTAIQEKLGPFGLGHKLGDAAAGKSGDEAIASIKKVWEGLMASDWSVRAPAAEKISKSDIKNKISALSAEEQIVANALLARLGIKM